MGRSRLRMPFDLGITLLCLVLCLAYAVTFSHMLHVSLMEQVFYLDSAPARFIGRTHYHNAIEWTLLVVPAVVGWIGAMHGEWLGVNDVGAAGVEDANRDKPGRVEVLEGSPLFAIGAVGVGVVSRLVWIVARSGPGP